MMPDPGARSRDGSELYESSGESGLLWAQSFVVRRWPIIVVSFGLVLIATWVILSAVKPRFTAQAEILLDSRRERPFGPDNTLHLINMDATDLDSAVVMIRSSAVLGQVVESQHLAGDQAFSGASAPGFLDGWWRARPAATEMNADPHVAALAALSRALRVERISKAYALAIGVTASSPYLAAKLANAVADAFVRDQRGAHLESSRRAAAFFAERLAPLGEQLRRSEDTLEQFRRDHDLIAKTTSSEPGGALTTLNEQQLTELNTRLAAAKGDAAQAGARYDQARAVQGNSDSVAAVPDVLRSNLVVQLRERQAELFRQEAELVTRHTDAYGPLAALRADRRDIERSLGHEMTRILAELKGTWDVAKAREERLRANVTALTGAAGLDSDLGPRLRELERVRLVDQTVFETYLAKAKAAEQQSGFDEEDVRVISPAEASLAQSFPQVRLVMICITIFGLGLGVALGLAADALDPGFITPSGTEEALGMPVLATVPWLRPKDLVVEGRLLDPHRFLAQRPHSRHAEAIQAIRVGIRMSEGSPAKVILITSSVAGEGKSLLSFGLALSAARAGQRVLLLDADLRRPALSRYFGFEHRLGLVDMLAGLVGTEETTIALGSGLSLMPSGRRAATAPDLFASTRMATYLAHVRGIYDLVVIDAAPAGAVVDAKVLAHLSDRILFVVGWRATARDLVGRNLRSLGHPGKVAGLVLNKIDERKMPSAPFGRLAYGRGGEA